MQGKSNPYKAENIVKIKYKVWLGKLFEVEGKDKNKDKAKENAFQEITKLPYIPHNYSLLLTKYIPLLKEYDERNAKDFELDKSNFLKSVESSNNQFLAGKKDCFVHKTNINLVGFKKILDNKKFKTSSRLICGLGSSSVLETSITLHHIWGIPYVPGTSFKGVCREVVFWKLAESKNINSEDELKNFQKKFYGELAYDDKEIIKYQLIFGAQDFKGLLLFLDAYPEKTEAGIFDLDIMNPHYSEYYSDKDGKVAPGDWENPVPIFFLTVKENIPFTFTVLFDEWRWNKIKQNGLLLTKDTKKIFICFDNNKPQNISTKVELVNLESKEFETILQNENFLNEIIKSALEQYGIGSKRNSGYGIFKLLNQTK